MTLSPTRNNLNCTFPRFMLHACVLTRTISLSYHGISLSFHLVYVLFHSVTCSIFHLSRNMSPATPLLYETFMFKKLVNSLNIAWASILRIVYLPYLLRLRIMEGSLCAATFILIWIGARGQRACLGFFHLYPDLRKEFRMWYTKPQISRTENSIEL